jgi:hypothetical protein
MLIAYPPSIPHSSPPERYIIMLTTDLPLNVLEVERLNISKVEKNLTDLDFGIKNLTGDDPANYLEYFIYFPRNPPPPVLMVGIYVKDINGGKSAFIDIGYHGSFPESQLETKKQWVVNKTNQVATICNITLDWTYAHWSIAYQD